MRIIAQEELAPSIYRIVLYGKFDYAQARPGCFVMLKLPDGTYQLRRPLAIAALAPLQETITLIYRVVGDGTHLLQQTAVGAQLNILGPLGNGFPIENVESTENVLLVGGGTGVPPLMLLAQALKDKGCKVTTAIGFRTAALIFGEKEFEDNGQLLLATDDGSKGFQGNVGQLLATQPEQTYTKVYACGPNGLLQMVQTRFAGTTAEIYLSLESRMACGVGACEGCVVSTKDGTYNKRVCVEGPVFNGREVRL
ncbi:dihydroorotate oxidase, electron transfer subunit [Liquorilactobacillus capillatus DSM 19910]|uniref:Dihydroorotate oxidase, electron transfer subunit n=2 Tax=Liquorilactobacillus capillatus TaxID=480931 RepID=A0A0R1M7A7_9LACO|nr:dihydroorotate oxidase, electron transfer subunit [Liquorilactobacillus capillatus DSM 19910]